MVSKRIAFPVYLANQAFRNSDRTIDILAASSPITRVMLKPDSLSPSPRASDLQQPRSSNGWDVAIMLASMSGMTGLGGPVMAVA